MTQLDTWMEKNKRDDVWLAEKLGVSRSQASRIRRGLSRPSLDGAVALQSITRIPAAAFAERRALSPDGQDAAA